MQNSSCSLPRLRVYGHSIIATSLSCKVTVWTEPLRQLRERRRLFQTFSSDHPPTPLVFHVPQNDHHLDGFARKQPALTFSPMSWVAQPSPWGSRRVLLGRRGRRLFPSPLLQPRHEWLRSKSEYLPQARLWKTDRQKSMSKSRHQSMDSYQSSHGASHKSMPRRPRVNRIERILGWRAWYFVPSYTQNPDVETILFEPVQPSHNQCMVGEHA